MPPITRRSRATLRARLIAIVVAVAAVALIAVDIALPVNLHSSLISDRDATLTSVINSVPPNSNAGKLAQLANSNPLSGEIGWSLVNPSGVAKVGVPVASDQSANPSFGPRPPQHRPETVPDAANPDRTYRALGIPVSVDGTPGYYLVAWVPLDDVNATIRRLVITELLVTAAILLMLGIVSGLVIRRELKPLEAMAAAADRIARGDLDAGVDAGDPRTEIGRLGNAFNGMLEGIRALLHERMRSEDRLRQFVADASHELRTPVAAVRGYTDLYDAGALPDPDSVERAMQRMGFEAKRMGALVDDLLTLIKADSEPATKHDPVDLVELLGGVVEDARVIDSERTWRLVAGSDPQVVLGDRLRLHQLFANLLGNVRTHTPPGTMATVSVLSAADHVAVAVADDGPGVAPEQLPRLFDRFYRGDPSRSRDKGGTGLGLAIVAAIVTAHRGRVVASCGPGGGLTMTVLLPRPVGTAAAPPLATQEGAAGDSPTRPGRPAANRRGNGPGGTSGHAAAPPTAPTGRADSLVGPQANDH